MKPSRGQPRGTLTKASRMFCRGTKVENLKKQRLLVICGLVLIIGLGAVPRLYYLGSIDTKADEVQTIKDIQRGQTPWRYFVYHYKDFKISRHMPLPRVLACASVRVLGPELTLWSLRIPFALAGILTVLVLWKLGLCLLDHRLGLILAFLGAINPFAIYWSRIAYAYALMLLFVPMVLASFASLFSSLNARQRPKKRDVVGVTISCMLASYTHMSLWPLCFGLYLTYLIYVWRGRRNKDAFCHVRVCLLSGGIWALFLLPWAWVFLTSTLSMSEDPYAYFGTSTTSKLINIWRLPFVMTWGGGSIRGIISIGLIVTAILAGIFDRRVRPVVIKAGITGFCLFAVLVIVLRYTAGWYIIRYFSPVWPLFMILSAVSIYWLSGVLSWNKIAVLNPQKVSLVLCGALFSACLAPMIWLATMPAPSIPYTKINRWMDANLPKGTPVLVDRWFEPWNEMRFHAPTNVIVTFTIPSEPLEVFKKYHWRDTARQFFKKFPDAAYLEISKKYFSVPEVGFWHWPREYFKQHVIFTNEQALALGKLWLMPYPYICEPGSNTNRVIVELFYNLPEDVVEMARDRGEKSLFLYGEGWGYTKLWPRVQDFRDWRVLESRATLDLYNLTGETLNARLKIQAVAVGGAKQVQCGPGTSSTFLQNKLVTIEIGLLSLEQGKNTVTLVDQWWQARKVPLLVSNIALATTQKKP